MTKSKSRIIYFGFILAAIFAVFLLWQNPFGLAQIENIKYPVAELGNCKNQADCERFCDKDENILPCVAFAESHGLMSAKEAARARQMAEIGVTRGPGGCRSEDECESYCDKPGNIKECLIFAKDHNMMPSEEIEEAEKVLLALEKGAELPGGCKNKDDCEKYCEDPNNLEQCVAFAQAAGFMDEEEAVMVRKTGGKGPGGCRGKKACDSYCEDQQNMEECITFAIEHDLMPPEEQEEAQKILAALQKGAQMPNCRGRDECDEYCGQPENMLECVTFAEAAGFMSEEEAIMAKKMAEMGLTGGPGGCRSKDDCEEFCENPDNMLTCVEFAEKMGMMDPEEAAMARKMAELGLTGGPGGCRGQEECEEFCEDPDNMETCIDFAVKTGMMDSEEAEEAKRGMEMMRRGGPGGCKSQEECEGYCQEPSHMGECIDFSVEQGFMSEEDAEQAREGMKFIGKCGSPEECFDYCMENSDDSLCEEMMGSGGSMPDEEGEEMMPRNMPLRNNRLPQGQFPEEMEEMMPNEEFEQMMPEEMEENFMEENFEEMMPEESQPSLSNLLQNLFEKSKVAMLETFNF